MSTFNTSLLRSLSSSLPSLKLIIPIFSPIYTLHLTLQLLAVEDCQDIFKFIWGVSLQSLMFQNYFDRAVWFLSRGLETKCLWLYSLCFQFPPEIPIWILSLSLFCSMGEMHAWYTTFFELHRLPKEHYPFLLQFQKTPSCPPLFLFNSSKNLLWWLFKILCILFVQEQLIFWCPYQNFFHYGSSLLKCLSRRIRKYLPMLILVSLQNGGLNQIKFFSIFSSSIWGIIIGFTYFDE